MTTAVASPFDLSEVINKYNTKMLNYKNNILTGSHGLSVPCSSANMPSSTLLDRKAVGTPSASMYQRRHSVTLPSSSRLNHNQFLNLAKPSDVTLLNAGLMGHSNSSIGSINCNNNSSSSSNKENRLRERSYSETGERLLHKGGAGLTLGPLPTSPTSNGNSPCLGTPTGQVNSSRYKTELCRPFEENGSCKYGDKCQFAHGAHELRSLSRHPKYKTELCRTFHTIGFCPYGPRCHFIHNAEERRGPPSAPISPLSASNGKMERPQLHHSFSFAGFPSAGCASSSSSSCSSLGGSAGSYLRDGPTSLTPPPTFPAEDEIPEWPSSNPFTFSGQKLANIFCPSLSLPSGDPVPVAAAPGAPLTSAGQAPPSPTGSGGTPSMYLFRAVSESPQPFEFPSSQTDSLSDQEGYHSSSGSSSLSGSESPVLDTSRRLPIFSRLSISDD
ncbi:hypothetical protein AALO_G00244550 [Alosa alosa]|uniref:mRNA decay activator protein ZFP36 n=1 Tax=Alosa alosa TaxID=278164 RepID=A0AAV6FW77_9TELE|nr:mRNA decay activator protein ZFP36L1a [Alosa alosa]KAG5265626.1 hypothetical protein AALO_G00244550 [Alosa alosa]